MPPKLLGNDPDTQPNHAPAGDFWTLIEINMGVGVFHCVFFPSYKPLILFASLASFLTHHLFLVRIVRHAAADLYRTLELYSVIAKADGLKERPQQDLCDHADEEAASAIRRPAKVLVKVIALLLSTAYRPASRDRCDVVCPAHFLRLAMLS